MKVSLDELIVAISCLLLQPKPPLVIMLNALAMSQLTSLVALELINEDPLIVMNEEDYVTSRVNGVDKNSIISTGRMMMRSTE